MYIDRMTMTGYAEALGETRTMVVPFGVVEAHGSHLPLGTDTIIVEEVVRRAAERTRVLVAPPVHYGVCTSTGDHPGTVGITPATLRRIVRDIVTDAHAKGVERFVLLSGHAGGIHVTAMREAAERLVREIPGIVIAACSIYDLARADAREIAETVGDSHGGEMETSMVMRISPELVSGSAPAEAPDLPTPIIARDKLRHWPGAVWGDPAKATEDKGERLINVMADRVVELIRRVNDYK